MLSERITSTMKSEPGRPGDAGNAAGTSVSAAVAAADGNFTAGAAAASCGVATVEAAPATATPARNLRRSTFIFSMRAFPVGPPGPRPRESLVRRAMLRPLLAARHALLPSPPPLAGEGEGGGGDIDRMAGLEYGRRTIVIAGRNKMREPRISY